MGQFAVRKTVTIAKFYKPSLTRQGKSCLDGLWSQNSSSWVSACSDDVVRRDGTTNQRSVNRTAASQKQCGSIIFIHIL